MDSGRPFIPTIEKIFTIIVFLFVTNKNNKWEWNRFRLTFLLRTSIYFSEWCISNIFFQTVKDSVSSIQKISHWKLEIYNLIVNYGIFKNFSMCLNEPVLSGHTIIGKTDRQSETNISYYCLTCAYI